MKKENNLRIKLLRPLPWVLLSIFIAICLSTQVNISPDSGHYLDIASNLASGKGLSTYYLNLNSRTVPDKALLWPPLYPLLLAGGLKAGLTIIWSARLILIISFVITSICLYLLGKELLSSTFGIICLMAWFAVSQNLSQNIWSYAWSESVFVALSALFLLLFIKALNGEGISNVRLLLASLVAGLSVTCRYIGISSVFAAFLSLIYFICFVRKSDQKPLNLLLASACLAAGFLLALFPLFRYNLSSTGSVMGVPRPASIFGPFINIVRFLKALMRDLTLPLGVSIVFLAVSHPDRRDYFAGKWNSKSKQVVAITGLWALFYGMALVYSASRFRFDEIDTRLASPVYFALIPLILFVGYSAYFIDRDSDESRFSAPVLMLIFLLLSISALYNGGKGLRGIKREMINVTPLESWINQATEKGSLLIGKDIWWLRFKTNRLVLESGYPIMPRLTPPRVVGFLNKFQNNFHQVFLLLPQPLDDRTKKIIKEYQALSYEMKLVYQDSQYLVQEMELKK